MALQVTSCTLMSKPDKLLGKGACYFKTRTNTGLFSLSNSLSAVESLKASRRQFYVTDPQPDRRDSLPRSANRVSAERGGHPEEQLPTPEAVPLVTDCELCGTGSIYGTNDCERSEYSYGEREAHCITPDRTFQCEFNADIHDTNSYCSHWQHDCPCAVCCDIEDTPDDSIYSSHEGNPPSPVTMDTKRRCSRCRSHDLDTFAVNAASPLVAKPRDRAYLRRLQDQDAFSSSLGSTRADSLLRSSRENLLRKTFRRQNRCVFRSPSDFSGEGVEAADLPRRASRTGAELDRFFNDMGLDKTSVMGSVSRRQSQSFSDVDICGSFASLASVGDSGSVFSVGARSDNCRDHAKPDPDMPKLEKVEVGNNSSLGAPVSIVERNARIIKWLCSVRRAGSQQSKQ